MSVLLNICGLLVATEHYPDMTLQQLYQQYYHCSIQPAKSESSPHIQSSEMVSEIFSQPATWWPVFTADQLQSNSFKELIDKGVKPGVILPDEYFSFNLLSDKSCQ